VPAPKQNSDRDKAIAAKHRLGQTYEALASEYGLTRQRISQIVKTQTPRAPGEAERAEIAATLRRKYDELQAIIDRPALKVSAMAKPTMDPRDGSYVLDQGTTIRAVAEQARIMDRYRAMFGTDITQPPAPLIDARTQVLIAGINQGRAAEGLPPLRPLNPVSPSETVSHEQANAECDAALAKLRAQHSSRIIQAKAIDP
jgi:transcriptional regulator with XRE-family HTH domain